MLEGFGSGKINSVFSFTTTVTIDEYSYKDIKFYIVPNCVMPYDVIIGQQLLQRYKLLLDQHLVQILPVELGWFHNLSCSVFDDGSSFVLGNNISNNERSG